MHEVSKRVSNIIKTMKAKKITREIMMMNQKDSALSRSTRIDVLSGQKKVDWGNHEGYNRDGQ